MHRAGTNWAHVFKTEDRAARLAELRAEIQRLETQRV